MKINSEKSCFLCFKSFEEYIIECEKCGRRWCSLKCKFENFNEHTQYCEDSFKTFLLDHKEELKEESSIMLHFHGRGIIVLDYKKQQTIHTKGETLELDYYRKEDIDLLGLGEEEKKKICQIIDKYNPRKEIIFMFFRGLPMFAFTCSVKF